jgi:hypothetical protein
MINNHNYYKILETTDLLELLAEATQRYSKALAMEESERTLESFRELIALLHDEIHTRNPVVAQAIRTSAGNGNIIQANSIQIIK